MYVPKPWRRRDLRIGVEGSQVDHSQMADLTHAQEYDEGFAGGMGYDRMEEDDPFYQREEEGSVYYQPEAEAENDEAEADGGHVPGYRDDVAHDVPIVGPPFPRGPRDTTLLSKYAKHVAVPLWVNDNCKHFNSYTLGIRV